MLNTLSMWGHTLVYSAFLPGSNSQHHSIHLCPEWKCKCNHHRGCSQPLSGLQINQAVKHSSRLCDASSRTFIRFYKLIQLKQPTQEHIRMELQLCESTDDLFLSRGEQKRQNKTFWGWMQISCFILMTSIFHIYLYVLTLPDSLSF